MKLKFLPSLLLALTLITSCDDSSSDEFNDANGDVAQKLIESITVVSAQDATENETVTINYDANDRVSSVTDGIETSILVYDNNELTNVTGSGETLNVEELYEAPYDAFETGEVVEYDNNGNPVNIRFFEEEYDYMTDTYDILEYYAEVSYDDAPNPFFYTLEAAGIIDVLDDVELNFSMDIQSPEIVQARMLLPVNNISSIVYKDADQTPLFEINADYVYDTDNYPSTATVTGTDLQENETSVFTATFVYRE